MMRSGAAGSRGVLPAYRRCLFPCFRSPQSCARPLCRSATLDAPTSCWCLLVFVGVCSACWCLLCVSCGTCCSVCSVSLGGACSLMWHFVGLFPSFFLSSSPHMLHCSMSDTAWIEPIAALRASCTLHHPRAFFLVPLLVVVAVLAGLAPRSERLAYSCM